MPRCSPNRKLFSGAATKFGAEPNEQVSFVDAAMPGMLPVINRYCVEQAVRTGLGLKAKINLSIRLRPEELFLSRSAGRLSDLAIQAPHRGRGRSHSSICRAARRVSVGIERLHLEQDAGKSLHDQHPDHSYVDLNRAGVALMEIVSRPDMRSSEEAAAFLKKLRAIVRYLGTCDGNMDEGSMRADVNVSVRKPGARARHALRNQERQFHALRRAGHRIRGAPPDRHSGNRRHHQAGNASVTITARAKRAPCAPRKRRMITAISPIPICCRWCWIRPGSMRLQASLPELPDEKKARFINSYGLAAYDAGVIVAERELADYFEELARGVDAKLAANWLNNEFLGRLNRDGLSISAKRRASASANNSIIRMIADGTISGKIAKDVLDIVWSEGGDPRISSKRADCVR